MIPFFWVTVQTRVQNSCAQSSGLGKYFILGASEVQLQAVSQVPLSEEMTGQCFGHRVIQRVSRR